MAHEGDYTPASIRTAIRNSLMGRESTAGYIIASP